MKPKEVAPAVQQWYGKEANLLSLQIRVLRQVILGFDQAETLYQSDLASHWLELEQVTKQAQRRIEFKG